jgi:redox-sensitive bicupin YhaK (pirin superfamily)
MRNTVFHLAATRGSAHHGWLQSYHTFSFAQYYNPERMRFGALRVLNDDTIQGGIGFDRHPHENMEIISIPLEGEVEHKDSEGNVAVIRQGDVQVMSAGTGIYHSEYNKNEDQIAKFLQIWVIPNTKGVIPRYDQVTLNSANRHNQLQQIVSPHLNEEGVWIYQNAWFHLGEFDKDFSIEYTLRDKANGVYCFVLEGQLTVDNQRLNERDGFGVWNTDSISMTAHSNANILLMEVPMVT